MGDSVANQFKGLDMHSLIAGPLIAASEAQAMLAASTANFIKEVGLETSEDGENAGVETVKMSVPLLSIVKIPTLAIDDMNITFDMEVKSAESSEDSKDKSGTLDANAKLGFGPFSAKVNIKGSIACHEKNTRTTDNSARYHISVHAKDFGTPEGLARMLDVLATASTPIAISTVSGNDEPTTATDNNKKSKGNTGEQGAA